MSPESFVPVIYLAIRYHAEPMNRSLSRLDKVSGTYCPGFGLCTAVRVRAGRANARRQCGQWADRLCFGIRTQRAKRARIRHLPKALPLHIQHRGASDLQSGEIGLACNAHPRAQARPRAAGSAGSDLARGPAPSSLRGPRTSGLPRGSSQASRDSPEGTRIPASRTPPCGTPIGCVALCR